MEVGTVYLPQSACRFTFMLLIYFHCVISVRGGGGNFCVVTLQDILAVFLNNNFTCSDVELDEDKVVHLPH
jgi:hypothetical protein